MKREGTRSSQGLGTHACICTVIVATALILHDPHLMGPRNRIFKLQATRKTPMTETCLEMNPCNCTSYNADCATVSFLRLWSFVL